MRLGFHLSIAGSLRRAVHQAQVLGCEALQIFVQNPRGWKWRPVAPAAIQDFIQARAQAGLRPLVVHLGYLPNLATADPALYALSTERLCRELELARDLGADYLVARGVTVGADYSYSENDSNFQDYSFERSQVTLRAGVNF